MPPRAKIAAPIDRPLSRAVLREFKGWATASSPGLSDPTTLRLMENCVIKPDGAVGVRPALRSIFADDVWLPESHAATAVGSFEPFFLNDGSKALLFAVRETISAVEKVGFRVAVYDPVTGVYSIVTLDSVTAGFTISPDYPTLAFSAATTYVRYVQIDNKIFALSNADEPMRMFTVGETKTATYLSEITYPDYTLADRLTVVHPTAAWIAGSQVTVPSAETPTSTTLISSTASNNVYNFAYFYTFTNAVGESAASMLTVVKTQRRWSAWNEDATDHTKSADQLVASVPTAVWNAAVAQGATAWNLYMLTWSDQDPVPVEGVLLESKEISSSSRDLYGWIAHTPLVEGSGFLAALPNPATRYNYTAPSHAAQGLVAGDRLVLVNDRTDAAVIRWSSNIQGNYTDFSASKGGGLKTLTSGNLYVPACVKLWQNPQSVDTITILCLGVDGYSTSYYMAPAAVAGQSEATAIMGFEETTATPGTVSPYGCEVLNNALYHPLDWALMKSTASNYNINHKPTTDLIRNKWVELRQKQSIVSSQLDNWLFYIVNNPDGAVLEDGCMGNEIWVCDTAKENTWSRWLIQATSLHKLEILGKLYMAVVRPEGIFVLDDLAVQDTVDVAGVTTLQPIPWLLETNTQGANRAHDAWAHLQQLSVIFGNVQGTLRYGIRGWDANGKPVEVSKIYRDLRTVDLSTRPMPYDIEDFLRVARDMKEWVFFASSVDGEPSYGQINLVQYRYTPVSVNIGYEFGSVETFEYGRAVANDVERTTDNGVPQPYIDTRYP